MKPLNIRSLTFFLNQLTSWLNYTGLGMTSEGFQNVTEKAESEPGALNTHSMLTIRQT
jgi:hypothetical protein